MNRPTLTQAQRKERARQTNPIYKAVSRQVASAAQQDFASQLLTTRIQLLSAVDGQDATDLLAYLTIIIGTTCEAGMRQFGHVQWVSQLHGALRTIQALCLAGYKWNSAYALALDRALEIAATPRDELDVATFTEAWVAASQMAGLVWAHQVDANTVATAATAAEVPA